MTSPSLAADLTQVGGVFLGAGKGGNINHEWGNNV